MKNKKIIIVVFCFLMVMLASPVQAAKIRVLVSIKDYYNGKEYGATTITYKKNGMIKKYDNEGNDPSPGGGFASFWNKRTYSYNGKNQFKTIKMEQRYVGETTYKYSYSNGKVKSYKASNWSRKWKTTCKYNKNNRLIKTTSVNENSGKEILSFSYKGSMLVSDMNYKYSYDKKGNLIKRWNSYYTDSYSNFYNGSMLVKRNRSGGYSSTYIYKTLKVSKKLKKKINAQQWALLNNNNNFALGIFA